MSFGNQNFMEIMLILVAVLLLFRAKRLPEIGAVIVVVIVVNPASRTTRGRSA
jgi:Sec-independent protein translocase protein TatA